MRLTKTPKAAVALAALASALAVGPSLADPAAGSTSSAIGGPHAALATPIRPAVPCYLPPIPFPTGCTPPASGDFASGDKVTRAGLESHGRSPI
ncbi:MAG TPA: hypothetical protein VHV82_04705 [Sporichthyaceae bacterium]|nr:hypothetical protein [Sporichthyaceae bacterium]